MRAFVIFIAVFALLVGLSLAPVALLAQGNANGQEMKQAGKDTQVNKEALAQKEESPKGIGPKIGNAGTKIGNAGAKIGKGTGKFFKKAGVSTGHFFKRIFAGK
ncbi:MAG: hypothetical protein NT045_06065 [Candidatus Aureabacteria bacterium]|nr:hypothetical protein [Candidatus Auribacterota bacterium]